MNSLVHIINKGIKRFDSIKCRLIFYTVTVFMVIYGIAIFTNYNFSNFLNEYDSIYINNTTLNSFYENIDLATENIKNFCYTRDENDYSKYTIFASNARNNINYLIRTASNKHIYWEYKVLSNMLDTFTESAEAAAKYTRLKDRKNAFVEYEKILKTNDLISRSIIKYFDVLNEDMDERREGLYNKWFDLRRLTVIILAAVLIFGGIFTALFIRSINRPINQLVGSVNKVMDNDYDVPVIKGGGREIGILLSAFNKMASSIGFYMKEMQEKANLQEQLYKKENENLKMKDVLREAELKALQSQMNPHFLFNTMALITNTAYIEGAEQTCELLEATTELLRYNVDKCNKISDFKSEVKSIENILYIYRKRFGDRIEFEMSIDEGLPNVNMPALIFQPIIENAVKHGIGDIVNGGKIKIRAKIAGDFINVKIEDNGSGMDSERIECILSGEKQEEGEGIGLLNVKTRLEMFFGTKRLFNIESSLGCGTVVSINIPLNQCSEVASHVQNYGC